MKLCRTITMFLAAASTALAEPSSETFSQEGSPWRGVVSWWGEDGPAAREHPSLMVFDDCIVILGGSGYEPQGEPLGDAWAFTTSDCSWQPLALKGDVPTAAGSRRVAQSPGSDHAWLFGGYHADFATNNELYRVVKEGNTLTFELIEQVEPPRPRALHAFALDADSGTLIVSQGVARGGLLGDTLIGHIQSDGGVRWEPIQAADGPTPRFGFAYGFDSDRGELIITGGQTQGNAQNPMPMSGESWVLRCRGASPAWTRIESDATPAGRRNPMFAFDDRSDSLIVWGGTADARTSIPGIVRIEREGEGSWSISQLGEIGAPPLRSSGVGFVDARADRVYFGFGNNRTERYQQWVTLSQAALHQVVEQPVQAGAKGNPVEPVTPAAVENAIREYVVAKYAGDVDAVRSRAHPSIARRAVSNEYWRRPSDEWVRPYGHDTLQFYGTRLNETRRDDPRSGRCEVVVHDVEARTAAATVIMEDVVDMMHLVRFDGRWVIADSAVVILDQAGDEPPAISRDDEPEIRRIVRDYCMGFYEIDGDKVQKTCHPILSKRTVERWAAAPAFDYFRSITWEEIRILGNTFNRSFGFKPETARCEIDVYEIRDNIAIAKLTASVWFDYFQLMKVNGEWVIVNIMFEPLPDERSESP